MTENELSNKIIGLAIEVHTALGPGLPESAYKKCLYYKTDKPGLYVENARLTGRAGTIIALRSWRKPLSPLRLIFLPQRKKYRATKAQGHKGTNKNLSVLAP